MSTSIKTTQDKNDIIKLLDSISQKNCPIDLITEKNKRLHSILNQLDIENGVFNIKFKTSENVSLLKENRLYTIGCSIDGTTYNFISKCIDTGPYAPRFSVPTELTIIDKRSFKRYSTTTLNNPYIDLIIDSEEQTFMLSDLSQGGLSFIIPVEQQDQYKIGTQITISKIGTKVFENEVKAKIVHLSPLSERIETQMKVGLQYEKLPNLDH